LIELSSGPRRSRRYNGSAAIAHERDSPAGTMSHRILICDDEPHIALAVGMKFRNAGFAVHTARNGQEAWESILISPPDVLITDCTMPLMDGIELCRRIRTLPALHDLPIFLLTARGFELDPIVVTEELRISKLILKPFSPRDLFHDVQEALKNVPAATTSAN
jgi:two-component system, OmpR family, alkaline phosphatase synthesis response regulator PhoP